MLKVTVKELRELIREGCSCEDEKKKAPAPPVPVGVSVVVDEGCSGKKKAKTSPGLAQEQVVKTAGDGSDVKTSKTPKQGKVLLDEESDDALDKIRTVSQLVMQIRAKLARISDPKALQMVMAVVDAVSSDPGTMKTLKMKDQKSSGFATGVRAAIEKARLGKI